MIILKKLASWESRLKMIFNIGIDSKCQKERQRKAGERKEGAVWLSGLVCKGALVPAGSSSTDSPSQLPVVADKAQPLNCLETCLKTRCY